MFADKDVDIRPEVLLERFNDLKVSIAEVKPVLGVLPGGLKTLLPTPAHKGMHRLLFILYKAIEKEDFSLLETKPNPWAQPKDEMNGSKKKFTLDLPQSYLGLLFGAQGKHIKAACKTYNAKVNVEERKKFDGSRSRSRSYQPMKTGFQVTLSTGPDGKLDLLEDHLVKKAAKIIRQREAHTRRVNLKFQSLPFLLKRSENLNAEYQYAAVVCKLFYFLQSHVGLFTDDEIFC